MRFTILFTKALPSPSQTDDKANHTQHWLALRCYNTALEQETPRAYMVSAER